MNGIYICKALQCFFGAQDLKSIDEAMVPFSGKSKVIVRMPYKPIPIGFKVWVMAQQGYFLQWNWHERGNGSVGVPSHVFAGKPLANTQAVVAYLLSKLPPPPSSAHGYHADNLFVTIPLIKLFRERGTATTGTTRVRGGIGNKFVSLKKEDDRKDFIPWGTTHSRPTKDQKVMHFAWKDNALVLLLSTYFDGLEEDIPRMRRCPSTTSSSAKTARVPFAGEFSEELPIPQFIDDYNHHMGGVDIGDRLRASYNWDRRTRRGGWRAIAFLFLLEVCITNSYQLWRQNHKENHLDFRHLLCESFFLNYSRNVSFKSQPVSVSQDLSPLLPLTKHLRVHRSKRGWCAFCSSTKRKAILTIDYSHQRVERKCKNIYGCEECNVPLCKEGDCWDQWHRMYREVQN